MKVVYLLSSHCMSAAQSLPDWQDQLQMWMEQSQVILKIKYFSASCKFTINCQLCRVSGYPCSILSSTGVDSTVLVVHCSDDQHAGLSAQHGGGQGGVRVDNVSLQAPSNVERFVSTSDDTWQLCILSLVYALRSKCEWNNLWWFCK